MLGVKITPITAVFVFRSFLGGGGGEFSCSLVRRLLLPLTKDPDAEWGTSQLENTGCSCRKYQGCIFSNLQTRKALYRFLAPIGSIEVFIKLPRNKAFEGWDSTRKRHFLFPWEHAFNDRQREYKAKKKI